MSKDIKLVSKKNASEEDWKTFLTRLENYLKKGMPAVLRDCVEFKSNSPMEAYFNELKNVMDEPEKFPLPPLIKRSKEFKKLLEEVYHELGNFIGKILLKDTFGMNEHFTALSKKIKIVQAELRRLIPILVLAASFSGSLPNSELAKPAAHATTDVPDKDNLDLVDIDTFKA